MLRGAVQSGVVPPLRRPDQPQGYPTSRALGDAPRGRRVLGASAPAPRVRPRAPGPPSSGVGIPLSQKLAERRRGRCLDCGAPATDECGLCELCARHPPCEACGSTRVYAHGLCDHCGVCNNPAWPGTPCAFCSVPVGISGQCARCKEAPLWKHFRAATLRAEWARAAATSAPPGPRCPTASCSGRSASNEP